MIDVLQTALHGLRVAEARAAQAAHNIATASLPPSTATTVGGQGETAAAVAPPSAAQGQVYDGGHPDAEVGDYATASDSDLALNIVELKLAQRAYEANAAVIRTAEETFRHLLDSVA